MREIVLDTETTGLSITEGHRIVDIGCVELYNSVPTGVTFQRYINPERSMSQGAYEVHGLSDEFLAPFPTFHQIFKEFLDFVQDAPLIIHNARFDVGFLNFELGRLPHPQLANPIVDTLLLARQKFPGSPANLNALCKRLEIAGIAQRNLHGALLDAQLLAQVYPFLLSHKTTLPLDEVRTYHGTRRRTPRAARAFSIPHQEAMLYERMQQDLQK